MATQVFAPCKLLLPTHRPHVSTWPLLP